MSPPANVKELSSDSRSSANIVEHHSPHHDDSRIGEKAKKMTASRCHLAKYNKSAYKLKQTISDVHKMNLR